ncbi:MAG: FAD-dependent oxidoreductase [Hydrotalea sp.]|nr:FAD-dependent oxidoreductase [Hydrotalea sp.]
MDQARVCIIGGGAMGVGLLYHLTKVEGWKDVVLVEKGELTSGSTWHAAGQVPNFIGNLSMAMVHNYGVKFYPELEKETGAPVGWHGCGGIRLACSDAEVDWFHYVNGIAKLVGFEMHLISPSEIKKYHPFIKTDDVKLGAYTAHDGHTDPASVTNAMAQVAKKYGADIRRRTTVTAIKQKPSGEWVVTTDKGGVMGEIVCEHVVNAAGCYGDQIMRMVGKRAAMSNMMHQYIVTETVKEVVDFNQAMGKELPVIRDPYSHAYLRQERDGILVGPYERSEAKISFLDNDGVPPPEFENALFEPEMDRLIPWLERAGERFPLFANAGIKKVISGPITHTPDGNVLMGPAAGLNNFWMATGASIGIAQGAGNGKYLAQWIVHGQSEINMRPFDPRRFGDWALGKYTSEKSIDDYQHMYHCHCPGEYHPAGRPITETPLTPVEKQKGGVFAEIHGWERVKWFSAKQEAENYSFRHNNAKPMVDEECHAVATGVGIVNMSSFSKFLVEGDDAAAMLDHLTTNKLPARDGGIVLTHALTPGGVYTSEFTMFRKSDKSFMLMSGASDRVRDTDVLSNGIKAAKGKNITLTDVSNDYCVLVVAGPEARNILQPLTQSKLTSDSFPWLSGQEVTLAGARATMLRVNYVGELGWEIYHKPSDMVKIYDAIWESAQSNAKGKNIRDVGIYAVNSLRLEKGYRGLGSELTNELGPIEAKMERFVDFNKDFVGKAAVMKIKNGTPRYRLVMLKLSDADHDMLGNEPVFAGDKRVGVTTGGAYGRRVKAALTFAYIKPEHDKMGGQFTIPSLGKDRTAEIISEVPYDIKNEKLKS